MRKAFYMQFMLPFVFSGCEREEQPNKSVRKEFEKMTINVTSPVYEEGGMISAKYTSDGENNSPSLKWEGVSDGIKRIVLSR